MNLLRCLACCTVLSLLAVGGGCAPQLVTVTGTVVKGGQPIALSATGALQVTLIPDVPPDAAYTTYVGRCDPATGRFEVLEVPPGRYKIAIEQWDPNPMTDKLRGAFNAGNTKFVQEIDGKSAVAIDLDQPPG